ncbi:MAG: sugar phosphate isomerase/epimerase [Spirochaetaceae bacterium]|nr:MAG: sugar phosphate isomerase/epimerase [Spirochaetaceae bacterium]
MKNTLAMQLYSLKGYEGGWDAAFDAVKRLGIESIEPWCGAVPNDPDAATSVASMRASLDRAGLKLVCGHMTVAEFDARYDEWKRFLLDYGSTDWVIPFAKGDTLDDWLALLPKFREMEATLKRDGLSIAYHNHHMELVKLGDKYVMEHLLDNMPELKAQFHIGQFLPSRGISLPDWIRKYEGRVCSIHVNDSTEEGPARVGAGSCKAEESIKTALDTGVTTFIVEVNLTKATFDDVARDVEFTRTLIG